MPTEGGGVSDRLLDAKEVAARLNVPETWVRAETRAGRMPCLELGRYRRYDAEAVHAWLEGCRAGQWNGRRKPTQREEA
jgi:excisionase family DNA binding protein